VSEGAAKKEDRRKFQAIRGTRDLLPPETELWNRVEQTAHEVFATFGFGEIRPPIFEETELFARSIGEETDVVSKEMYSFPDPLDLGEMYAQYRSLETTSPGAGQFAVWANILPGSQLIAARPEATASVCRAYIEHGMQQLPQPVKLYYLGPMFRRERPQKGRYRQFYQIGAEVLGGSDAPAIDAEVIDVFRPAGIAGRAAGYQFDWLPRLPAEIR
jgi:histidyl-tRNA synthetase